jgi:hypothetical protein
MRKILNQAFGSSRRFVESFGLLIHKDCFVTFQYFLVLLNALDERHQLRIQKLLMNV